MWHKIKSLLLAFSIILIPLRTSAECIELPRGVTSNLDEQFSFLMRSAAPCDRVLLPATFSEFDPMGESSQTVQITLLDKNKQNRNRLFPWEWNWIFPSLPIKLFENSGFVNDEETGLYYLRSR